MANYTFDMNSAIKAGYTPDQIAAYLDQQRAKGNSYQLTPTPQATPQQSQVPAQSKSNFIADMLPTAGAIIGGVGGALIPGLGETGIGEAGGSAVGSAAGEGLKELIEGQPLNAGDIATQGVIGGVGGLAGKGISTVAGKVLGKVGKASDVLQNGADYFTQGTRQIRVKPSVYGASKEQAINATLDKYGIQGTAQQQYEQLQPTMNTIEQKIQDEIANNPDAGANINDIKNSFMDRLNSSLRTGDLTKPQATSEVNGYLNDLLKAAGITDGTQAGADGLGDLNLGQLRDLKKIMNDDYGSVQKAIDNGTSLSARQKVIQQAWGSLDDAVKNASPEMKSLLTDQSNIYNAARSLSAARSNPPTLRVAGTSLPAPVTQTARQAASTVLSGASKAAAATPNGMNPILAQSLGQGITRTVASPFVNQNTNNGQNANGNSAENNNSNISQNNTQNGLSPSFGPNSGNNAQQPPQTNNSNLPSNQLPPSPSQAFGGNSTINSPQSQALTDTLGGSAAAPQDFMQGWTLNGTPVDNATKNMLWQVVNYRLDPTKMTSLKNNERQQVIDMASQVDPSYDSSQFGAKEALRKDFTSGTAAKTVNSLNTAIGHLYTLKQTANALGNGQIPVLNSAKNAFSSGIGQAQVNNFNTAASAVSAEMATVFKNSGATDDEIKQWRNSLNPNMSPAQLQDSIGEMIDLMNSRLEALQNQYEQGMGKPANFSFLSPQSQAILQSLQQTDSNQLSASPTTQFAQ